MSLTLAFVSLAQLWYHAGKEATQLLPRADQVLTAEDWRSLQEGFQARLVEAWAKSVVEETAEKAANEILGGIEAMFDGLPVDDLPATEMAIHEECLFLPDGTLRCRMIFDFFDAPTSKGGLSEQEIAEFVEALDGDHESLKERFQDDICLVPRQAEHHDGSQRYIWTSYWKDANRYLKADRSKSFFKKTANGFTLKLDNAFCDSMAVGNGRLGSQRFILPGAVAADTACDQVDDRSAVWRFDFDEWRKQPEKSQLAERKPRTIRCGPSQVSDQELENFAREFAAAQRAAAERRK